MNNNNFSVLYAEDDDKIRASYINLLKLFFGKVYEAKDGEEALSLYNSTKPDLAILDINMPVINGLEICKKIREVDTDIMIIILTAYSETDKLLAAIELSLTKYLIKPIKTFELEEILEKCIIDLKQKEKDNNFLYLDGGFNWNFKQKILFNNKNEEIKLTKKEILLLDLFCKNPDTTFSNTDILNHIWEDNFNNGNSNRIRILFSKFKTKINYNIFNSTYNVGYKIKIRA